MRSAVQARLSLPFFRKLKKPTQFFESAFLYAIVFVVRIFNAALPGMMTFGRLSAF
jgi:hypothetical protein